ncbi:hypothetical protein Pla175_02510 [Pirellulimonas nuda]|uniref:DUF5050 domain-containing protein n=1 Tax=Pirellulimonas nuda TaxID=2528009 RepID=A0A518D601_9BACT|nr:hypothetical protein [Pirellulimonas nuda]QDU86897.1 hypothetical protein Pla175_02510 [Pirellulimonas nuda]
MRNPCTILLLLIPLCSQARTLVVDVVSDEVFQPDFLGDAPNFGAFITYNDELYFTASIGQEPLGHPSHRLFKTDGETLTRFEVDPGFHIGTQFVEFQGSLYFRGDSGNGIELFRTDGVDLVEYDLSDDESGSWPRNFEVVGDRLYFGANRLGSDGTGGPSLMVLQDSVGSVVADVQVDTSYAWHASVDDTLYFSANGSDGYEVYRTDGQDVSLVVDANPGPGGSNPRPEGVLNDAFYFTAEDAGGRALYRATPESVAQVLSSDVRLSAGLRDFGGRLYFSADRGSGYELQQTDGGEVRQFDLNPGPQSSNPLTYGGAVLNGQLLLPATGPEGAALFVFSELGDLVRRIDIGDSQRPSAVYFQEAHGSLYFSVLGDGVARLYRTDGFSAEEIYSPPEVAGRRFISVYDSESLGGALFVPATTEGGDGLLRITEMEVEVLDLLPGQARSYPRNLEALGDQLVFMANGPDGESVYRLDGDGIHELLRTTPYLTDIYGNGLLAPGATTTRFVRFQDQLLFLANTPKGFQLFRIQAVPEPTTLHAAAIALVGCVPRRWRRSRSQ